jgi:hypothetical protein
MPGSTARVEGDQRGAVDPDEIGLGPRVKTGVRAVRGQAGVVDQQVDRAVTDGGDDRRHARRVGQVGRHQFGRRRGRVKGVCDRAQASRVAAGQQQPGPAGGEPAGDLRADAGGGAGHHGQVGGLVRHGDLRFHAPGLGLLFPVDTM